MKLCDVMLLTLAVFGCVAALMAPAMCCLSKEYKTRDGECCPMCLKGSVVRRDCTQQPGTGCSNCGNGTYMNQPNGLRNCFLCTSCDQGTSRTDTVCELCQPGHFSQDGLNCTVWTSCSETQVKIKEGSSSSDVVCGAPRKRFFYIPVIMAMLLSLALVITGKLSSRKTETSAQSYRHPGEDSSC
ncbi:tumor necrosis factor receptor superfamily member 14-like isoform X10 [Sebastes fasciatus]|uniref:tumor necrosis factor receptor superfamily member 14-like isoform X10 n=1 Tax=Sebastes fasciatus TaxID=394691 RepID=UPI003D9DE9A8